jgi:predicted nucleotidyltransferase
MGTILEALFPSTRRVLLVGFFRQPGRRFYLREVIRNAGTGQGAVQRELANLVEAGLLVREEEHGRVFFRANARSPVFQELRALVHKTAGVPAVVQDALKGVVGVSIAFIFGSVARGQEHAESDVDLAVIGDVGFRTVVGALSACHEALGREVNPVVYAERELRERLERGDPFVTELVAGPKWFVVGEANDLRALAGERVVDQASDLARGDPTPLRPDRPRPS